MSIFIILPNQLYEKLPKGYTEYYLIEHPVFFVMYKYNKAKLLMHRYTMKLYNNRFPECKYINYNKDYRQLFQRYKNITTYDPVDHYVANDFNCLAKKYKSTLKYITNPGWIDGSLEYKGGRVQTNFYKWQRQRLKLFPNKMNPLIYDAENRKPVSDEVLPLVDSHVETKHNDVEYNAAVKYVSKHFASNPGTLNYWLPADHSSAKKHLQNFFKYRLKHFGTYEDAINPDVMFGFHSVISPLLGIGLLTPTYVIDEVKQLKGYPFNSIEGFIRQIIGWREYCRLIYVQTGPVYGNRFKAHKPLPISWYKDCKDDNIIGQLINKTWEYGYLHHIERLMLIGNFMTLSQFKPEDCYKWFMCAFLDSYHVFMETNLYGMAMNVVDNSKAPYKLPPNWKTSDKKYPKQSQYMTNRLYICSSNYIKKMGWKLSDDDKKMFDDLYHVFVKRNLNKTIRYFPGGLAVR